MDPNSQVIMRSQVMAEINSGRPFDSLQFVTADRKRGTGGKLIDCRKWMRLRENLPLKDLPAFLKAKYERILKTRHAGRNTKHFVIFNPAQPVAHPITVHYWLMVSFNGKRIING